MRVLFVSNHFPSNLSTSTQGIYKRMGLFIDALKAIAELEMLFFVPPDTDVSAEAIAATEQAFSHHWQTPITLHLCPTATEPSTLPKWREQWEGIFNFFSQTDFLVSSQQVQALEACLSHQPDAVFVHRLSNMSVAMQAQPPLPPIFFDLDDIEHIKFIRQIRQPPTRLQTLLYYLQVPARLRGELQAIRLADRTFVCSEHDRRYLSDRWKLPGVVSVPNAIQIPEPQPLTPEPTLLLLGGYYYFPNINAANFLIEKVWHRVHQAMPQARLIIAGSKPENIRSYDKGLAGVEFTGFVDDLAALYQRSRVVCCPILSGGGTRVKMIEAAAYGKPIVSTRIGAEGLEMTDGKEFLLRDRPQDFADACIELLQNDSLCHSLGTAARSTAIDHYDRSIIVQQIQNQMQHLLAPKDTQQTPHLHRTKDRDMYTQDERKTASSNEKFEYELSPHNGTPSGNYFWYRKRKQLLELLDRNFEKLFQSSPKQTFLDLGCGQGVDLFLTRSLLQSRCPSLQFIGLDGWSKNIEVCQLRKEHFKAENIELHVSDITQSLPFEDSQIDVLYCSEVVEHLLEPQILFAEIKRILKPNGYLILTTPNEPNVFQASFWLNSRRQKANAVVEELRRNPQVVSVDGKKTYLYGHISCKRNQEWDAILQQVGFNLIDNGRGAITYGSTRFFDSEWVLGVRFLLEACLDVIPRRISRPFSNQLIALYKRSEV